MVYLNGTPYKVIFGPPYTPHDETKRFLLNSSSLLFTKTFNSDCLPPTGIRKHKLLETSHSANTVRDKIEKWLGWSEPTEDREPKVECGTDGLTFMYDHATSYSAVESDGNRAEGHWQLRCPYNRSKGYDVTAITISLRPMVLLWSLAKIRFIYDQFLTAINSTDFRRFAKMVTEFVPAPLLAKFKHDVPAHGTVERKGSIAKILMKPVCLFQLKQRRKVRHFENLDSHQIICFSSIDCVFYEFYSTTKYGLSWREKYFWKGRKIDEGSHPIHGEGSYAFHYASVSFVNAMLCDPGILMQMFAGHFEHIEGSKTACIMYYLFVAKTINRLCLGYVPNDGQKIKSIFIAENYSDRNNNNYLQLLYYLKIQSNIFRNSFGTDEELKKGRQEQHEKLINHEFRLYEQYINGILGEEKFTDIRPEFGRGTPGIRTHYLCIGINGHEAEESIEKRTQEIPPERDRSVPDKATPTGGLPHAPSRIT
ncbi:hypothetical protein WN51_10821 [Melipona quadrifasciata]|uniref:Uncharacterized protein n=1 Tax=Melipona quadrifasciata TaxID=166423 RepID=A0A0M9A4C1_9HYME|nr:hypothetical protein WN51_10821 [Melipona quadrifasciata]